MPESSSSPQGTAARRPATRPVQDFWRGVSDGRRLHQFWSRVVAGAPAHHDIACLLVQRRPAAS